MEKSGLLGKIGKGFRDFLFGTLTAKEYQYAESFMREFYPKRIHVNKKYDLMALKEGEKNIQFYRGLAKIGQPLLTATYALPFMGYLNGEHNGETALLHAGLITMGKFFIFALTKWELHRRGKLQKMILEYHKDCSEGDLEKDLEGEEWKRGTDYPLSEDLDF